MSKQTDALATHFEQVAAMMDSINDPPNGSIVRQIARDWRFAPAGFEVQLDKKALAESLVRQILSAVAVAKAFGIEVADAFR